MFVLRKIWQALLSCYLRFEIRPLAVLPTKNDPTILNDLNFQKIMAF